MSSAIAQVIEFAAACHYEKQHSQEVAIISLLLFDQLQSLHKLGAQERLWLEAAGLLHDIGWVKGQKQHHKTSRDMIIEAESLPFTKEERVIIGLVARYHRKSLPDFTQKYFGELDANTKIIVEKLAALLRLADGLNRSHANLIEDIKAEILFHRVVLHITAEKKSDEDVEFGKEKSDLFTRVFGREVEIDWKAKEA